MSNQFFQFKQFTVFHDRCAMKVGTDGVLLGAWASVNKPGRILDVGTGSGLIALMLAQRSNALIDALEIDPESAAQAMENVKRSPWYNRISVVNDSFQNLYHTGLKYDMIISNPPYFSRSLEAPEPKRKMARHNSSLDAETLAQGVSRLLTPEGAFHIIIPSEAFTSLSSIMKKHSLMIFRQTNVFSLPGSKCIRVLAEFRNSDKKPEVKVTDLIIETGVRHSYSDEYKELTKEFYLNF